MNRGKEPLASLCEKKFILDAIKDNKVGLSLYCTESALMNARLALDVIMAATLFSHGCSGWMDEECTTIVP